MRTGKQMTKTPLAPKGPPAPKAPLESLITELQLQYETATGGGYGKYESKSYIFFILRLTQATQAELADVRKQLKDIREALDKLDKGGLL